MLAACCEAEPGEETLVALGRESQKRWPAFAEELEQREPASTSNCGREGTLVLALTADDQATIAHHLEFQRQLDSAARMAFGGGDARARAAACRQDRRRAVFAAGSSGRQPQARAGFAHRRRAAGVEHSRASAGQGDCRAGRAARKASCSKTAPASRPISSCWRPAPGRARIGGLPPDRRPPVRPIKGQMLALRMDPAAPLLTHVLWAPGVYLVPRRDGRLIVGATVEEKGFDDDHHGRRPADLTGSGLARDSRGRGIAGRRDLGRPSAGQSRRCADPRARSARWLVLCDRASSQRHFAGAGDGGRHGAPDPRRGRRAGDQAVRARALSAGPARPNRRRRRR